SPPWASREPVHAPRRWPRSNQSRTPQPPDNQRIPLDGMDPPQDPSRLYAPGTRLVRECLPTRGAAETDLRGDSVRVLAYQSRCSGPDASTRSTHSPAPAFAHHDALRPHPPPPPHPPNAPPPLEPPTGPPPPHAPVHTRLPIAGWR